MGMGVVAELRGIEELLASRLGLNPVSVGSGVILRAVRHRMAELGLSDLGAYEHQARGSDSELELLIDEVVVPESWFFRDEQMFQFFREHVRVHWLADPRRAPLRVLSLPCAGGEEPYSIAMTLCDLGLSAERFRIDAVDVSNRRLLIGRRGLYPASAFRSADRASWMRFFQAHPQGYEVASAIRVTVRFLQASVRDPQLLEGFLPYDVIFCRNLVIYLDAQARAELLAVIDRLLAADGLLFIGHADRFDWAGAGPKFAAVGDPGCFAYCRAVPGKDRPAAVWLEPSGPPAAPVAAGTTPASPLASPAPASVAGAGRARPVAATAGMQLQGNGLPSPLERAGVLANQGRHDEALAACEEQLRLKGHTPEAYYLKGMIHQAAADYRRAEDCFHKAVYLDPEHDEALLALALLAKRRGDERAAAGFRRRAERVFAVSSEREKSNG